MNDTDSAANARAVDSLPNYETVKYFNNEAFEARRCRRTAATLPGKAATTSQISLSWLNLGQQAITVTGVTAIMGARRLATARDDVDRRLRACINAFAIQRQAVPLNFPLGCPP